MTIYDLLHVLLLQENERKKNQKFVHILNTRWFEIYICIDEKTSNF